MVKRYWKVDELIESWTLLPKEMELLGNKTGENRIGFAVLLKFFSNVAQFPLHPSEVPETVLTYIAKQVKVPVEKYANYDWQGRTIKYHRAQIRKFLNFREATVKDASDMVKWLKQEVLPVEQRIEFLEEVVYKRFRELCIEPSTPGRIDRLIRTALHQYETYFCADLLSKLPSQALKQIDTFLAVEDSTDKATEAEESEKLRQSDFSYLKTDPGSVGLGSLLTEVEKLYRNPDEDLPTNFEVQRQAYYQALTLPLDAETFITNLQQKMSQAMHELDQGMPNNQQVSILSKRNGSLKVSPFPPAPEPMNLARIKAEINQLWPMTSLLDILKETDLRVGFTQQFKSMGTREILERGTLQKRLLLCLYGLGTNTGLMRINTGIHGSSYQDLLYVRRRFLHKEQLRNALASVVNAIFEIRLPQIWGEGTTTCASDSKKFGAWDQNLMTEWHVRYGGRGVMIYWHVEKNSTCIYSQLKTCSSSEVAAMIEGVLRHCTNMQVKKNYVDSHGQNP